MTPSLRQKNKTLAGGLEVMTALMETYRDMSQALAMLLLESHRRCGVNEGVVHGGYDAEGFCTCALCVSDRKTLKTHLNGIVVANETLRAHAAGALKRMNLLKLAPAPAAETSEEDPPIKPTG